MDLRKYYSNLLTVQYHEKEKAVSEIELGASTFAGDWVLGDIADITDVDTAVGKQLDLIGKIVGLSRIAQGFTFGIPYYSYDDEGDPMHNPEGRGFSDIGHKVQAQFKDYEEARKTIYEMSDGSYRNMLKLKILSNNSRGTLKEIDDGLYQIFGTNVTIVDNMDMTATITVQRSSELDGRLADFLHLFTRPLGVSLEIIYL
ncbi:MAG: DUF2612 domain-containing protein [Acutalibacteraceae bacterium]|nr:DUF2612 domain-containing protein [Acutalibacteraceae bacterium]